MTLINNTMFNTQQIKIKRIAQLVSILSKYGFNEVLYKMNLKSTANSDIEIADSTLYTRIRLVLEELGPTFIKLGQALSNREDILPREMVLELQKLQNQTQSADIDLHKVLEDNLGTDYREHFKSIDNHPLGSASIAQVYQATLKNGEQVVLKIKRPHVERSIKADLLLMKDLVSVLSAYFDFAQELNLEEAVYTFEKSLLEELSMVNERHNIERMALNFKGNNDIYVPKVYPYLCNDEILCMERINGFKITDIQHNATFNSVELVQKGLNLYLIQILEHGFFHADPHAGNIMVNPDGKISFIDLGAMGEIYPYDKELLEDLVLQLMLRNTKNLVKLLQKMAVSIEVKDERKLEQDLSEILNTVENNAIENIQIYSLLDKFKQILFENKVVMPNYFTLLARGLVLIESVGRTLVPNLNIMQSIKPYVEQVIQKRMSPQYLFEKGFGKMKEIGEDIYQVPTELRNLLYQLHEGKIKIQTQNNSLEKTNKLLQYSVKVLVISMLLSANIIATTLFWVNKIEPVILGISLWSIIGLLISGITSVFLFLQIVKKR